MASRDKILSDIRNSTFEDLFPLPEINLQDTIKYEDLSFQFKTILKSVGGTVIDFNSKEEVIQLIRENSLQEKQIINIYSPNAQFLEQLSKKNAEDLKEVERAYIAGEFAVAENGAIWISEKAMGHRLLPFICQHLVLIIERKNLVATMHEVFLQMKAVEGFGSFIAGPSKTADIEQSLVIGAHGARSLTVYLINA